MSDSYKHVSSEPIAISTGASAMPSLGFISRASQDFIKKNTGEHAVVLPTGLYPKIGELIALWAFQEWLLIGCVLKLLGIDRKEGRIAVGAPRIEECIKRIRQLLLAKDLNVNSDLSELSRLLKIGEGARDLVGHGIWMVAGEPAFLCVQDTSGAWGTEESNKTLPKRIYPEAKPIDDVWFKVAIDGILDTIKRTQALSVEIDAIAK